MKLTWKERFWSSVFWVVRHAAAAARMGWDAGGETRAKSFQTIPPIVRVPKRK